VLIQSDVIFKFTRPVSLIRSGIEGEVPSLIVIPLTHNWMNRLKRFRR